jgi:hypothetical protein
MANQNDHRAKPEDNGEIILRFRPLRDSVPWPHRVRRLLKVALRAFNLRCTRIEQLPADGNESNEGEGNEPPEQTIRKLQQIINGMARRIAEQSELLTRLAERKAG